MPRRSVRVALSTLIGAGLAAACQFSPAAPAIDGGGGRIDATVPGGDGSGPDGAGEVGACLAVDPAGLIECFEFDDDLGDGLAASGLAGARDADLTGGLPAARPGSPAVTIGPGPDPGTRSGPGRARPRAAVRAAPGQPRRPAAAAAGRRPKLRGPLRPHRRGQPARLRVHHGGAGRRLVAAACTWDGTRLCALRWSAPDDHQHFCTDTVGAPAPAGAHGLAMGHLSDGGQASARLVGAVDAVHVWSRALSADALCAELGQPAGCMPCDGCD
jgi:hypothetical protein